MGPNSRVDGPFDFILNDFQPLSQIKVFVFLISSALANRDEDEKDTTTSPTCWDHLLSIYIPPNTLDVSEVDIERNLKRMYK